MDYKDYYATLGVAPAADKIAIQQAFRQLARKYHPDLNPGNKETEEKFKTINEAYQVLSDVEQRKKYDQLRTQYQQWQQSGRSQQDFDWQNWSAQQRNRGDVHYGNEEEMDDPFATSAAYSDFFTNIFSQNVRNSAGRGRGSAPKTRRGRDIEYEIDLTLQEAFTGTERLLEIDKHRIQAHIPMGVRTGSKVRLTGQGEPDYKNGPAGDLYLMVNILPNPVFERDGDNLHMEVPVDMFTAVVGGETTVATLDRPLTLKIPPKTNAMQSFRLRGKGMPHLGDPKTRGDLFARVKLVLPESLTDQEINLIREVASARAKKTESSPK